MLTMHHRLKNLFIMALSLFILSGCAIGTTELQISHNEINTVSAKKTGHLLIKEFIDSRQNTTYIGNKRNGFGAVLGHVGMNQEQNLETILTLYFAEALEEAGYQVTLAEDQAKPENTNATYDAIIEGEILEFWMDLYMAVWHKVKMDIKAIDPQTNTVLWQKEIADGEKRVLWVGATGEYERIVREAITKTLNKALVEFSSDEFDTAIHTK